MPRTPALKSRQSLLVAACALSVVVHLVLFLPIVTVDESPDVEPEATELEIAQLIAPVSEPERETLPVAAPAEPESEPEPHPEMPPTPPPEEPINEPDPAPAHKGAQVSDEITEPNTREAPVEERSAEPLEADLPEAETTETLSANADEADLRASEAVSDPPPSIRLDVSDPEFTLRSAMALGIPVVFDAPEDVWQLEIESSPRWRVIGAKRLKASSVRLRKLPSLLNNGKRLLYSELVFQAARDFVGAERGGLALLIDNATHTHLHDRLESYCLEKDIDPDSVLVAHASFVQTGKETQLRIRSLTVRPKKQI